jgi:DtxR family Mn-dependent transcriptional regulator
VTSTTENYLKKIYSASEQSGEAMVGLGRLAQELSVTPGTVTTMMKHLAEAGLVEYRPRAGVLLTETGRRQALDVIRKHRLIELFLVKVLGLDWSEVHDEAEMLEHAISDSLLGRIDDILGHPKVDPHGDPIPDASLSVSEVAGILLSDVEPPADLKVIRVAHQPNDFLGFLTEAGLVPGARLRLIARDPNAETLTVDADGIETSLSINAAGRITVRETK